MILLLALPVLALVAVAHHFQQIYGPSNLLVRRVRASHPTLGTVATMLGLAAVLLGAMKCVSDAVATGAPGWLNLVVLILAWDAIKIGWLAVTTLIRTRLVAMPTGHHGCDGAGAAKLSAPSHSVRCRTRAS